MKKLLAIAIMACAYTSAVQAEGPNCAAGQIHLRSGGCMSKELARQRGYIHTQVKKAKAEVVQAIEVPADMRGSIIAPSEPSEPVAPRKEAASSPYGVLVPMAN